MIATTATGRRIRFPHADLAAAFGPSDADYSWRVFSRHARRLKELGYAFDARRILEIGPGRDLGGAVLWWAACGAGNVRVVLWDVFPNMAPHDDAIRASARALVSQAEAYTDDWPEIVDRLQVVIGGGSVPAIDYTVCDAAAFAARRDSGFDLVLSHSALEHVWSPEPTLDLLAEKTSESGWHSMQIDLMDHGSRDTNFLEMLEWSSLAYWLTMRFTPGALNRWRAARFIEYYEALGLDVIAADRRVAKSLPTRREYLANPFRGLSDRELLTTELFLVSRGFRPQEVSSGVAR